MSSRCCFSTRAGATSTGSPPNWRTAVDQARIEVAGVSVGAAASVGATYVDASCADPDAALALADNAMYAAKARHAAEIEQHRMSWGVTPRAAGPASVDRPR